MHCLLYTCGCAMVLSIAIDHYNVLQQCNDGLASVGLAGVRVSYALAGREAHCPAGDTSPSALSFVIHLLILL